MVNSNQGARSTAGVSFSARSVVAPSPRRIVNVDDPVAWTRAPISITSTSVATWLNAEMTAAPPPTGNRRFPIVVDDHSDANPPVLNSTSTFGVP